jgi:acyl-CoA thioester hydrolase
MFKHSIAVRFGEVDLQAIVFNAHYLAYCDDAVDTWWRGFSSDPQHTSPFASFGLDLLVKKATLEWHSSARLADRLEISCFVSRWGNSSFDVSFAGVVGARAVFDAVTTYVMVDVISRKPRRIPDEMRVLLGQS